MVSLNDAIGRCVYFTGDYDKKLTWLCRRVLQSGDTAIDIGANIGLVSLTMAQCVGPEGRVHSFEPNPRLQEFFKKSIDENGYRNIVLHECAVGDEPAVRELNVPRTNYGQGSFKYHAQISDADRYQCRVVRLSDVIKSERIEKIRLVKIDVEGFEYEVLSGADSLLQLVRPDIIVVETNENNQPRFSERAVVGVLLRSNYRLLSIPRSLFFVRVAAIDPAVIDAPSHDIIAVPAEKYDDVVARLSQSLKLWLSW